MHSSVEPPWLREMRRDTGFGPTLYAWTPENLPEVTEAGERTVQPTASHTKTEQDVRRIHILGTGNMGCLLASALAKLDDPPPISLVVHRKELLQRWAAHPYVEVVRNDGCLDIASNCDVEWWTEEPPRSGPVREVCAGAMIPNLVVATKAQHALVAVDKARRYLGRNSTVFFVQNGVNRLWPPHGVAYGQLRYGARGHPNWLLGVATHGAFSRGPFISVHASPGNVSVGAVLLNPESSARIEYMVQQLCAAPGLDAYATSRHALWVAQLEKLVVNSIINPLTTVLQCKNGALFFGADGKVDRVMDLLLAECSSVLQGLVMHDSSEEVVQDGLSDASPQSAHHRRLTLLDRFSVGKLKPMLRRVGEAVKDNTSSMLQDASAGRQTEVREFNGWLVDMADFLGRIDVSNHEMVMELVERSTVLEASELDRHFPAVGAL